MDRSTLASTEHCTRGSEWYAHTPSNQLRRYHARQIIAGKCPNVPFPAWAAKKINGRKLGLSPEPGVLILGSAGLPSAGFCCLSAGRGLAASWRCTCQKQLLLLLMPSFIFCRPTANVYSETKAVRLLIKHSTNDQGAIDMTVMHDRGNANCISCMG